MLDYGGARRTTLRGRENIFKRYRIQAACANLSLLLRHLSGVGMLKQTWAASERALAALTLVLLAVLRRLLRDWWAQPATRSPMLKNSLFCTPGSHPLSISRTSTVC